MFLISALQYGLILPPLCVVGVCYTPDRTVLALCRRAAISEAVCNYRKVPRSLYIGTGAGRLRGHPSLILSPVCSTRSKKLFRRSKDNLDIQRRVIVQSQLCV